MPSQDANSDPRDAAPDPAPSRSSDTQRWGRGSATALERMKELERRHGLPGDRPGGSGERKHADEE